MNRLLLRRSTAGFTLIEILVVVIMVGILASIAAPSWLGYMNNRRMGAARDQILQALRQAQTEASRRKQEQTVEFLAGDPPRIQVLGSAEPLGQGEFKPGMVQVRALNGTGAISRIRFDASGNLVEPSTFNDANTGLRIIVSTPTGGSRRCIFIRTLLGSMQSRNGNDCN